AYIIAAELTELIGIDQAGATDYGAPVFFIQRFGQLLYRFGGHMPVLLLGNRPEGKNIADKA
ncbi:MAG: hypothetical protein ACLUOI_21855, partial [Eisenbergiella sp.]